MSEYKKFKQEEERLAQELIAAREAAIAAQVRTIHLEKQQRSLCSHAREMLRHGLNTLDELEEMEHQEQEEREASECANQLPSLDQLFPELAGQGPEALEQAWRDLISGSAAQPASQT